MLRPILSSAGDILVGVTIAGLVLAVLVPVLIKTGAIVVGDWTGGLVIAVVLGAGVSIALLRPGGALRRRSR